MGKPKLQVNSNNNNEMNGKILASGPISRDQGLIHIENQQGLLTLNFKSGLNANLIGASNLKLNKTNTSKNIK